MTEAIAEPTADELAAAWAAAEAADEAAREAWAAADQLMYAAYAHGWRVAEIGDAVGIGSTNIAQRRLYRRLRRPFEQHAEAAEG